MGLDLTKDERVIVLSESGCWIWSGDTNDDGYGRIYLGDKKRVLAHRYSYEKFNGEIPSGLCVCHKCDVPSCINPDHLWLGTHAQNMSDRNKKGRARGGSNCGEKSPASKLTEPLVIEIFQFKGSVNEASKKFGIAKSHVSRIRSGKSWFEVTKNLHKCASA